MEFSLRRAQNIYNGDKDIAIHIKVTNDDCMVYSGMCDTLAMMLRALEDHLRLMHKVIHKEDSYESMARNCTPPLGIK